MLLLISSGSRELLKQYLWGAWSDGSCSDIPETGPCPALLEADTGRWITLCLSVISQGPFGFLLWGCH